MNEFDKWCKNNYNPDEDLTASEDSKEGYKDGREDGWRAALEWAENLFVQLNSFEVEETINKELRKE